MTRHLCFGDRRFIHDPLATASNSEIFQKFRRYWRNISLILHALLIYVACSILYYTPLSYRGLSWWRTFLKWNFMSNFVICCIFRLFFQAWLVILMPVLYEWYVMHNHWYHHTELKIVIIIYNTMCCKI